MTNSRLKEATDWAELMIDKHGQKMVICRELIMEIRHLRANCCVLRSACIIGRDELHLTALALEGNNIKGAAHFERASCSIAEALSLCPAPLE